MVFYKATRPDATDFRTGTITYEPGRRVRPHPYKGERRLCGPGLLHASDVPAETLVGGSWPCRLFEVTGKPVAGLDGEHPHKAGFRQLQVGGEVDARMAFGPNGQAVAALIDRVRRLTPEEATALDAAWDAARDGAWDAPRVAALDAAWDAARGAARGAALVAARVAPRDAALVAARVAPRDAARDAAWDAACAVVVRDLISAKYFDVLYEPWREVIG